VPTPAAVAACDWTDTEVSVSLERGAHGRVSVHGRLCASPVWARWDGTTLWLVGSGASPVGTDEVRVRVELGPGVTAAVRSVAATVVYAARGEGTRWDTEVHVAEGASLDWRPEPVILTARARHRSTTTVHAAAGAKVLLDEVLVLGREGERPGAARATLDVRVDGAQALLTSIDTSLPGWSGPAGVLDARVVAHRLRLRPPGEAGQAPIGLGGLDPGAVRLDPAPGCHLGVATGPALAHTHAALDAVLPA